MLHVIMLSVTMLNVIMPNVVEPTARVPGKFFNYYLVKNNSRTTIEAKEKIRTDLET
jgi:hypothetical protein